MSRGFLPTRTRRKHHTSCAENYAVVPVNAREPTGFGRFPNRRIADAVSFPLHVTAVTRGGNLGRPDKIGFLSGMIGVGPSMARYFIVLSDLAFQINNKYVFLNVIGILA